MTSITPGGNAASILDTLRLISSQPEGTSRPVTDYEQDSDNAYWWIAPVRQGPALGADTVESVDQKAAELVAAFDIAQDQDTDLELTEVSVRLKALHVQQQLGIQFLSIANSDGRKILSLFQ